MKSGLTVRTILLAYLTVAVNVMGQEIPNDPNHLPTMIGGRNSGNSRIDSITVSGRVKFDGIPVGQSAPSASIAIYSFGRLVGRHSVTPTGAYSINDVPREGSTIVVEVDHVDVANRQIIPTPAAVVYQDFNIAWIQVEKAKTKAGVVSVANLYKRGEENQRRFDKALEYLRSEKFPAAISELQAIVANDPADHYAWLQLGNVFFLAHDYNGAEAAYQKVIDLNSSLVAYINMGRVMIARKDYDKAIQTLSACVQAQPSSADANHYLGEAFLMAKKGSKAVVYLNEAIRLAPVDKAELHLRLAALYDAAGLKQQAAVEYKTFLEKVPDFPKKKELETYIKENRSQ